MSIDRFQQQRVLLQQRAYLAVSKAIKLGQLQRQPCAICRDERQPVWAHHDDYSKPLEIRWLCPKHHAQWHKNNGDYRRPAKGEIQITLDKFMAAKLKRLSRLEKTTIRKYTLGILARHLIREDSKRRLRSR